MMKSKTIRQVCVVQPPFTIVPSRFRDPFLPLRPFRGPAKDRFPLYSDSTQSPIDHEAPWETVLGCLLFAAMCAIFMVVL